MQNILKPTTMTYGKIITIQNYLALELNLPSTGALLQSVVVRPAGMDHIEIVDRGDLAAQKRRMIPYLKYITEANIALLRDDAGKLQRYVEVTRDCLVPLYLGFVKLWETANHLCEFTTPGNTMMTLLPPQLGINLDSLLMNGTQWAW